jgi:thymidylate synthase (FAD)
MNKGYTIPVLDHGFVRYIDHMGDDRRIVDAARVSYGSERQSEEKDKKLLFRLYRDKHTSPFEMAKLTLNLKMPIFIARQYVRHRMQNLNEYSARYKELPDEFYIPKEWRKQGDSSNKQGSEKTDELNHLQISQGVEAFCIEAYDLYKYMLSQGIAREMARMVLPLNIYTEMWVTWDMKNLLHFITLREDSHAQAEIQEYGKAIKQIAAHFFPWTIEAYETYKFMCVEQVSMK